MNRCVTANQKDKRGTAAAMHETAEALERSEAILHESAEQSPDAETRRRLHRLGDEVTRQAMDIDRRADLLPPPDSQDR
jgi:hypothetical protein